MISKAQRGFITGRDIRENVVLVQSLLQHKIDGVMIFIDWSKAYDRVDYEWLEGNLVAFGFGEKSLRALRTTWRGFDMSDWYQMVSLKHLRENKEWLKVVQVHHCCSFLLKSL